MKVCVCVCTYNRPELLERLLRSFRDIELGKLQARDVDLIVVDNKPTDQARQVCESVSDRLPIQLHFAQEPQRGIPFARNRAISEALELGADLIAFIDDDDVPQRDWLIRLIEKQTESGADLVCGIWRWDIDVSSLGWARMTPMFKLNFDRRKRGIPPWLATCNALITRNTLERLRADGPIFSPEFGFLGCDDTDFFIRASKAGARIEVAEKSIISRYCQDHRMTFAGVLRHAFRNGNTAAIMAKTLVPPVVLSRQ